MLVKKAMAKRFTFKMPDTVSEETKVFMRNVIRELKQNLSLETIDTGALNMLMTSYEMYLRATENLLAQGPTALNRYGDEIPNPNQTIATKNYNQVLAIMKEYGLTVKARKNLKMTVEVEDDSPLEQFMKSKSANK
jgi:P27 family predicted phage terminase small subunit